VAAAAINIEQSAEENVIGQENPNWGEFAIDTALSYPGGKAIGYARDLSRPLVPLARTNGRAVTGRGPFKKFLEDTPFQRPRLTSPDFALAAKGEGWMRHVPTDLASRWWRAKTGFGGFGLQKFADSQLGQPAAK